MATPKNPVIYVDEKNRHMYKLVTDMKRLRSNFDCLLELKIEVSGYNKSIEAISKDCFVIETFPIGNEIDSKTKFALMNREMLSPEGKKLIPGLTRYLEKLVTRPGCYR